MTTKKEQALIDLDEAVKSIKESINIADEKAEFSICFVLSELRKHDDVHRSLIGTIGRDADNVLSASCLFGFSLQYAPRLKNPELVNDLVNSGLQYGADQFHQIEAGKACSETKH